MHDRRLDCREVPPMKKNVMDGAPTPVLFHCAALTTAFASSWICCQVLLPLEAFRVDLVHILGT